MQFLFRSRQKSSLGGGLDPNARAHRHDAHQVTVPPDIGATVCGAVRPHPKASHSAMSSWLRKTIPKEIKPGLIVNATTRDSSRSDTSLKTDPWPLDASDSAATSTTTSRGLSWPKNTALNALKLVLQALSSATSSGGLPGVNLPFESLLSIINGVQTTSQNAQGFRDLADRLNILQPTLSAINGIQRASNDSIPSLAALERELEKLRCGISTAISDGRVERFINSTEDASSLTNHNFNLDRIIGQLTLDVSTHISQRVDHVHAGVTRIENTLSTKGDTSRKGMSQTFHRAKINTSINGSGSAGGSIGSRNRGLQSQIFSGADITTGGGDVGTKNTSSEVDETLEMGLENLLKQMMAKSGNY